MKRAGPLAILGGKPEFGQPHHVGQLNLPEWIAIEKAFRGIFERQWYANHGPLVNQLDGAFADYTGVRHAVSVTNGTVGLMVLARALAAEGEVIVPAFTFPATAQALSWAGLNPVFCDVDPVTHNLSAVAARALVTPRTVAILGVHLWGRACDPEGLQQLADEFGLYLIYDACHAVACTHGGRRIGYLGNAEVFSFHATKVLNGMEGGCITTNDDTLAAKLRTIRSFHPGSTYAQVPARINGKMSEAQAAFALLSLADLPRNIERNRNRHDLYRQKLAGLPGLALLDYPDRESNNYQYIVVDVDAMAAGLSRDDIFEVLQAENVVCRRHFYPGAHRMPPFRNAPEYRGLELPVTERLCQRLLLLPNGEPMDGDDVRRICDLLITILDQAPAIRQRLGSAQ